MAKYHGLPMTTAEMELVGVLRESTIEVMCLHLGWRDITPKDRYGDGFIVGDGSSTYDPKITTVRIPAGKMKPKKKKGR